MPAPITYIPNFLPTPNEFEILLRDTLEWERRPDAPRCEYYCNDFPEAYTYGRGAGVRTYEPRPWTPAIREIRDRLESHTKSRFEVCFLNRYLDQSDHLGWHADDSPEMDDARPIAIVSLGVEREIMFRPKIAPGLRGQPDEVVIFDVKADGTLDLPVVEKLRLGHGSLCLMAPGMQDTWQHRIPKAGFQCGERISLTFRGYIQP